MLSVAIITYNEEDNIRDALESVKWADEIVVVDSFSKDRTVEICREYTDKVFSMEWSGFSHQKNKAISLTTMPWILVLDADERVTGPLRDEITTLLRDEPTMAGYYIPRKNFFSNRWIRHGGWWPDYTLRLFRRNKGRIEEREVHEAIRVDGEVGYLKSPLEHYTYRDVSDFLKRMELYSGLAAKELYKNNRRATVMDLLLRPPATFLRMLILRMGILDGIYGIILAWLYSVYTYKKYSKLRGMNKAQKD
jgi:glycosyltransferase involved in cell wall biosynthesis